MPAARAEATGPRGNAQGRARALRGSGASRAVTGAQSTPAGRAAGRAGVPARGGGCCAVMGADPSRAPSEPRLPDYSAFPSPLAVVRTGALEEGLKRRVLVEWLMDELALLVAEDEGMPGERAARFDEVLEALWALELGRKAREGYELPSPGPGSGGPRGPA